MQKLSGELKNTPMDAPQVCSSVNPGLNRDQSLSVQDIVLTDNNPEVDQSQHTGRPKVSLYVFVLANEGGIS